jgi:hypothetical protein
MQSPDQAIVPMRPSLPYLCALLMLATLPGCSSQEIKRKDGASSFRPFHASFLAKSDIDMLAEISQREQLSVIRRITEKLYRRNPQEFHKSGHADIEAACAQLLNQVQQEVRPPDWEPLFRLSFQEHYVGDRVQAFMTALTSMLMASYDYKSDFFLPDSLAAQKLYNSARNIEVAVWKLSNARHPSGGLVLISNSIDSEVANLSFEREFGKLIAQQDMLALVMEDRSNRSISRVFQNVAAFVFFPI